MKKMKKAVFMGGIVAALCSCVLLAGCKSKEEKAADAVNSVVNNVVDSLKNSN